VQDLAPVVAAIRQLGAGLSATSIPTWVTIVQPLATLVAVVFAGLAALFAGKSAKAARQAADYDRIRDLMRDFQTERYYIRFQRLDRLTKDAEFLSIQGTQLVSKPVWQDIWDDALSRNPRSMRADMLDFHIYSLRLAAWLSRG